jgi:hypothetical protein
LHLLTLDFKKPFYQNLWRESLAIKSIVIDLNVPKSVSLNGNEKAKTTGKRSILTAKSFSTLHDDECDSKTSITPGLRTKKIQNISRFTLESIVSLVADIRRGLENENSELEMEVDRLNREMESQAESVFTFNGNNNNSSSDFNSTTVTKSAYAVQKSNQCKLCGVKLFTARDPPLGSRASTVAADPSENMCNECDALCLRRDGSLLSGSHPPVRTTSFSTGTSTGGGVSGVSDQFAQMSMLPPLPLSSMNNNQRSSSSSLSSSSTSTPRSGSNGATSSRFRSRLNTARDELFFLDEF